MPKHLNTCNKPIPGTIFLSNKQSKCQTLKSDRLTGPQQIQANVLLGNQDLLYKVDHARLRIGHLPVLGQRLLALVTWQRVPVAEVHAAAGLCVAGHSFPPLRSLLVFCEWKEQKASETLRKRWREHTGMGSNTYFNSLQHCRTNFPTFSRDGEKQRERNRERRQTTRATGFACQY